MMPYIVTGAACFLAGLVVQAWRDTAACDRSHQQAQFWKDACQCEIDLNQAADARIQSQEAYIRALTGQYVQVITVDRRNGGRHDRQIGT